MKKTKLFLLLLFVALYIAKFTIGMNTIAFVLLNVVLILSYFMVVLLRVRKHIKKIDTVLRDDIKSFLLKLQTNNILDTSNIQNVIAFSGDVEKIVFLTYYFSTEWQSGLQLVFDLSDNKLNFAKYGKFGYRSKKYKTEANQLAIEKFVEEIEKHNIY